MAKYTKEELYNMPVSKLVDLILSMQVSSDNADRAMAQLSKIRRLTDEVFSVGVASCTTKKPGRKPMSDEEKAMAYERQKQRQREKYQSKKLAKTEE